MNLTEALHALGYSEERKASQSKYVYESSDGTWICTVWNDRTDYDAAIAHINRKYGDRLQSGDTVRVVHIRRKRLENGNSRIVGAKPDPGPWTVTAIMAPTPGFRNFRAILVKGNVDVEVRT